MSYAIIKNPSTFRQRASNQKTFDQLYQDGEWTSGASSWGRRELFAARVISSGPSDDIESLTRSYPDPNKRLSQPLNGFVHGMPSMDELGQKWDPELVRGTNPECLGLVWAALAEFVRREKLSRLVAAPPAASGSSGSRPTRLAAEVSRERTQEVQRITGEFRRSRSSSRSPSTTSASSGSLFGYVEPTYMPLLEGSTIRLVSSLCGLLLIYGQSRESTRPPLIWRADNLVSSFVGGERTISAADDGGIQMWDTARRVFRQVALLEAKRTLEFVGGKPFVTDEVLAQMVGQALALHRSNNPLYVAASPER
ncbi:uncharacterized protein Triagg1_4803 [Trichoderma aggressivum f. europaeum]|uniref:Uncharacterized protein n=1 Tax=Trichoderma aggressivum f. europaeum TaxID=173218 RepID=A0AAE1IHF8_9HYPO|nr:hypothetical protein Triagg1_4803 [Trichoderma aggressivum f. europaeum]